MKSILILNTLGLGVLLSLLGYTNPNTVSPQRITDSNGFTEASFKKFVALFPVKTLPYKIGAAEMNAWIERRRKKDAPLARPAQVNTISESFSDFIPDLNNGRFSRMGPDLFTPEAVLCNNATQVVLIYSRSRGYSERKGTQYLAVYSPKGKRLSEMLIAKSDGYKGFMGCNISKAENGAIAITTTDYLNQWANDKPHYSEENYIVGVKPSNYNAHILSSDGSLAELTRP